MTGAQACISMSFSRGVMQLRPVPSLQADLFRGLLICALVAGAFCDALGLLDWMLMFTCILCRI